MNKEKTNILIAPLNWGLGHAVRDIPLIYNLLKNKFEVIIGGEGQSGELLKNEFPELQYVEIQSFKIKYPKNQFFILKLLFQIPKIFIGIIGEHKHLQNIIDKYEIDIIISDNRYGLYSDKIPSVFITHQVFPALPKSLKIFEKIIYKSHRKRIDKFEKCLIPDFEGKINLSGDLSHKYKFSENYHFIGILSQFEKDDIETADYKYDIAVIISGPEPQRSIFEEKITEQILQSGKKAILISGLPETSIRKQVENLTIVNHLSRAEMQDVIVNSEIIISRSGYTTIMDLVKLQKKAVLIPTPGQTEQEYFSDYLKNKTMFVFRKQNNFDLNNAVSELKTLNPDFKKNSNLDCNSFINIIKSLK